MKEDIYKNYISNHYSNFENFNIDVNRKKFSRVFHENFKSELKNFRRNAKILDLGSGYGNLAYYFYKNKYLNYLGVDISEEEINLCKKQFKNYEFIKSDILKFLNENDDKYDLIFMFHVFEHFSKKEVEQFLKLIKKKLNSNGIFINVMPNADAYFNSNSGRYGDYTHEKIYNSLSFSQLLKTYKINHFEHKNYIIGNSFLMKFLHKITLKCFEIFIQILGYSKQKIYTISFITIIKNKKN